MVLGGCSRVSDVIVSDGRLLLLTARSGWTPTVTREVENWIRNNLDNPYVQRDEDKAKARKPPDSLSSLVQPLLVQEPLEDMLVFCPTKSLHGILLRAIDRG